VEHGDMESLTVTANGCAAASQPVRSSVALRALGASGLVGVIASVFLLAAGAAGSPGRYVPARSGGWPSWLAGPLQGLHMSLGQGRFQTLTLLMCAGYALALASARALPPWAIAAGVVTAYGLLLLGPPLISQDVLGYVGFARLGAVHGLDPYTHAVAEAPNDPILPFVGWPLQSSPYGPLFTLGSYALVPLGLAGALWAFKAIAAIAGLALVGLIAFAARRAGRCPRTAAVFVGLNPVLLELGLGGAHNDLLVLALVGGALALSVEGRRGAAAVVLAADVAIKASSGLLLPFLVLSPRRWRSRARLAMGAALALAALGALAVAGFGAHALGFLHALQDQQQLLATHSIPAETARWVGLHGLPRWWRDAFLAGFLAGSAIALWRTARGADWRAMAGWATLALLLSTAWLLPWYAVWLLPLAALADSRRLRVATLAFCAYAILIHLPLAAPVLSPGG
jgi:alpha-1,6-mannosyltransferase